jgi:hypothetical protein
MSLVLEGGDSVCEKHSEAEKQKILSSVLKIL